VVLPGVMPAGYRPYGTTVLAGLTIGAVRRWIDRLSGISPPLLPFDGQALPTRAKLWPLFPAEALVLARLGLGVPPGDPWPPRTHKSGDRLGLATPNYNLSLCVGRVFRIVAQRSGQKDAPIAGTLVHAPTYALFSAASAGPQRGFATKASLLRGSDDALCPAQQGFPAFTCDPSDLVVPTGKLPHQHFACSLEALLDGPTGENENPEKSFQLRDVGVLEFSRGAGIWAAVKCRQPTRCATPAFRSITQRIESPFDFKLAVDESDSATTPIEQLLRNLEAQGHKIGLNSLTLRLPGLLERPSDWRGIARALSHFSDTSGSPECPRIPQSQPALGSDTFLYPAFPNTGEGGAWQDCERAVSRDDGDPRETEGLTIQSTSSGYGLGLPQGLASLRWLCR